MDIREVVFVILVGAASQVVADAVEYIAKVIYRKVRKALKNLARRPMRSLWKAMKRAVKRGLQGLQGYLRGSHGFDWQKNPEIWQKASATPTGF